MPKTINAFQSEKHVITIDVGAKRYKILQVIFGKKDGSLFVNFPYYKHSEGLVSLLTLPRGTSPSRNISLVPGGKVTSHLVKYSHHPDGIAHFSQTGQVLSTVRKQAVPLIDTEDHIFTTQFQYPEAFEIADPKNDRDSYSQKRTVLNFSFKNTEPEAIKIVGRWYSFEQLINRITIHDGYTESFGPLVPCQTEGGRKSFGFLIAPKKGNPIQEYTLLLTCEAIPLLDKNEQTCLTFIGGFDPPHIMNDLTVDASCLALSYPTANYQSLRENIGSIDLLERK